jgi:signal transduction histidine kinase
MVSQVSIALSNANLYEEARRKISEGMKVTGQLSNYQVQLEEIVRKRTEELRQQYQEIEKEVTERKRAVLAEREQRTLAVALEKSASILNSTLDLDEVLDSMLLALENVIPHDSANIMLIDSERNIATVARYKGNPKEKSVEAPPTSNFPIYETPTLFSMYQNKLPFVIKDVKTDSSWIAQIGSDWIRSYLAAPILFGDEVLGFLNLVSDTKNFYSQEDAGRLQAFANHASIAIRNARLYDQAGDVAVLEERQRLARDMHDAVSQTLFTANVIAEALPLQWERDPMKGKEGLTKIKQLIQGALAEMRTLLVELRPDAISKSDLGDLINQIALGAMSYIEITPSVHISGRFPLPDDVQLALFRITQEIFNNISKHARANHVIVDFKNIGDEVTLRVEDDGRGFDPDEIKTGRLGISIMRERATSIGASLTINSQPGDGTIVQVQWRRPEEETIEK